MARSFILSCLSLFLPGPFPRVYCQHPSDDFLLGVTVTNKRGNHIKGLKQENFALFDEKVEQSITSFSAADEPVSIGILLDRSGSMYLARDEKQSLKEGMRRFLAQSNAANDYFLIGFNRQPQLLVEWTHDANLLLIKFNDLPAPVHNTALYDACYVGLEKVGRAPHQRHALILISDGMDNLSRYKFSELRRFLQESDAIIYGIVPPEAKMDFGLGIPGNSYGMDGEGVLDELTTISGGVVYRPRDSKELGEVFERIAVELRNQYLVTFKPISTDKNKYRRIKLKLKDDDKAHGEVKDLRIRVRQGYYAAGGK